MAIFKNGGNLTTGFNVSALAPIDGRFVADYLTDLIDSAAWSNSNASQYAGLVTYVKETGKLYILHSTSGSLITITDKTTEKEKQAALSNWSPVVDQSDLSKLSGVFAFKGVAENINEAQTILTLSSATATKGGNTYTVKCQTIGYEYDMDIYYGWGATANSILFWTDTPTLTVSSVQYAATVLSSVTKLVLNGEDYYPVDGTEPAVDGMQRWENVAGKVVYCDDPSQVYSKDNAVDKNLLGAAELVTYEAYDFVPLLDADKYTVSDAASAAVAAAGNSGHVYQIGENEYASNGQIWVKLGSPVEDWVIL